MCICKKQFTLLQMFMKKIRQALKFLFAKGTHLRGLLENACVVLVVLSLKTHERFYFHASYVSFDHWEVEVMPLEALASDSMPALAPMSEYLLLRPRLNDSDKCFYDTITRAFRDLPVWDPFKCVVYKLSSKLGRVAQLSPKDVRIEVVYPKADLIFWRGDVAELAAASGPRRPKQPRSRRGGRGGCGAGRARGRGAAQSELLDGGGGADVDPLGDDSSSHEVIAASDSGSGTSDEWMQALDEVICGANDEGWGLDDTSSSDEDQPSQQEAILISCGGKLVLRLRLQSHVYTFVVGVKSHTVFGVMSPVQQTRASSICCWFT